MSQPNLHIQEWDLTTTNQSRVRERMYEVAVLPVGATEPHNRHLPYGTDFLAIDHIARESCRKAWERCESVLCLPTLPYGVDLNLLGFPMTASTTQATLDKMVGEIFTSMRRHGLRKFVLLNGHGGNDFIPFVRQYQHDVDAHVFLIDGWAAGLDRYKEIFTSPEDHAGQMETSIGLQIFPNLVEMDKAIPPKVRPFRFEAMTQGWVRTSRDFSRMTDWCATADPTGASAEAGRKWLDLTTDRIASFLVDLAGAPIDDTFPFKPD